MMFFRYQELEWYRFGMMVGLRNLLRNNVRLGLKKTAGKILQPINYYTRFPEYALFGRALDEFIASYRPGQRLAVLDIGSPKLFGLHLAHTYATDAHLTDISRDNIDEYTLLWQSIAGEACGTVDFARADGRQLPYAAASFDLVYSMSVIEHVDGVEAERQMIDEMLRVLRPGGLLLLSTPFGQRAIEQYMTGFSYLADRVGQQERHFFQRICDRESLERQLLSQLRLGLSDVACWTVYRADSPATRLYHQLMPTLGENVGGLLGFLNPLWSALINRHQSGVATSIASAYGEQHSHHDIYGDIVIAGRKRGVA